ncbi:hypothetical protein KK120_07770 [Virgibacillus dakarensis]|nr:hypothetical protein [Virgibacillus dakarensis]
MYSHYPYQPTSDYQGKRETGNALRRPTGVQSGYNVPSSSSQFSETPNHQQYPKGLHKTPNAYEGSHTFTGTHNRSNANGYYYNPITYTPYSEPGFDMKTQLDHIQHLLVQLIEQNNEIIRHLQNPPEQSQTVSTPSGGGAVIVRM